MPEPCRPPTIIRSNRLVLDEITYSVSRLKAMFDITARTIRFYRQCGYIETSRHAGAGKFDRKNVRRLALIRAGTDLGFPLRSIASMMRDADASSGEPYLEIPAEVIEGEITALTKRRIKAAEQLRLLLACRRSLQPDLLGLMKLAA